MLKSHTFQQHPGGVRQSHFHYVCPSCKICCASRMAFCRMDEAGRAELLVDRASKPIAQVPALDLANNAAIGDSPSKIGGPLDK